MIIRNGKAQGLRIALVCGASLVAIALSPMAHAQSDMHKESVVYLLRYAQEIAEGSMVISQSKDLIMARERVGDRSMLIFDTQNGAITVERGGRTAVFPLVSKRGPEASFTFDYANNIALGNSIAAPSFNVTVRPLLASSPELGVDASWSVETTLGSLLIPTTSDAAIRLNVSRAYLKNDGKTVVLLEFEIPAFTYVASDGSTVVHWAHGMAVTDPGFAEIYALATQHRASVHEADGDIRPISVRTTMHGVDREGEWRMSFANTPEIQAAMARVTETQGNSIQPTSAVDSPTDLPVLVASRLNAVAFGVIENSANGIQLAIGASEAAETPDLSPATTASNATPTIDLGQVLNAALGTVSESNDRAREQAAMPFSAALTGVVDQNVVDAYNRNAADLANQRGYDATPPKTAQEVQQILDTMRASGQTNLNLGLSREAGAQSFMQLSDEDWEAVMNGTYVSPGFDGGDSSLLTAQVMAELQRRKDIMAGRSTDDPTAALQTISDVFKDIEGGEMTADQLDALVSQMAQEAMLEPRLQQDGLGGFVDLPLWIDPNSRDAEQYRRLVQELRRELEETRKALDDDKDQNADGEPKVDSGFGENEDFYANNAFDYTSMVGIVATDLGRWAEWLATQNMRELERLADNAGYPNLASALADAPNILRQSQDPGYRQWAMQAPSCNGPAGCGPSYLERWHMKQSIVALGDILADSRDIFSTGGFSDIGISGLDLSYLLRDHALEDGDIVRVRITQFGHVIYEGTVNLTNVGEVFGMLLGRGVASLEIFAVNEGSARPNTAQITVDDVVRGQATQTYSLATGETATLRIEAGAKPAPAAGTSGAPQ